MGQVTVFALYLSSPTLPQGRTIELDLTNQTAIDALKKNPVNIKEGVEYKSVQKSLLHSLLR